MRLRSMIFGGHGINLENKKGWIMMMMNNILPVSTEEQVLSGTAKNSRKKKMLKL